MRLIKVKLERLDPANLKQHEEADPARLRLVVSSLRSKGVLRKAVAADRQTLVLLDGAHRLEALRSLGCRFVPVCLIDYMNEEILVRAGAGKTVFTKQAVLDAGLSGRRLPPKSTRHMVRRSDGTLVHISNIEPVVELTLAEMGARIGRPER